MTNRPKRTESFSDQLRRIIDESELRRGRQAVHSRWGNDITVLAEGNKQYKVRLQHIDCPENGQPFATKPSAITSA